MASLISGFEYDIFISYRQKDNKHDGWVTEFVDNLKGELESTFKEEIGVYFDINPHDGLLETHEVSDSLNQKLKCLIFIPIISRTYCDPKSFAWEHEFKAFIELASGDELGLKIKLPNGNIASRILPVRIHDLDDEDIELCESMLDSALRGVEFIYKSAGVNRPLRSREEKPHDNISKTIYRDQINKVANAINEIIRSVRKVQTLKSSGSPGAGDLSEPAGKKRRSKTGKDSVKKSQKAQILRLIRIFRPGRWRVRMALIFAALIIIILWCVWPFLIRPKIILKDFESSVAVIMFDDISQVQGYENFAAGATNDIISRLARIRGLKIVPVTESMKYKESGNPTKAICRDNDVRMVLQGSVKAENEAMTINAELIDGEKDIVIWKQSKADRLENILAIQDELAAEVATAINVKYSAYQIRKQVGLRPTKNFKAYELFLNGNAELTKWTDQGLKESLVYYGRAIEIDKNFTEALANSALANLLITYFYGPVGNIIENIKKDAKRTLSLEPDNETALMSMEGYYVMKISSGQRLGFFEYRDMIKKLKSLISRNPSSPMASFGVGEYYRLFKKNLPKAAEYLKLSLTQCERILQNNPSNKIILGIAAQSSGILGQIEFKTGNFLEAIRKTEYSIELVPGIARTYTQLSDFYNATDQLQKARAVLDTAIANVRNADDRAYIALLQGRTSMTEGKYQEAEQYWAYVMRTLAGPGDGYFDYALLYRSVVLRKLGKSSVADSLINIRLASRGINTWPEPVFYFFAGRSREEDLLRLAKSDWQRCEAFFFLGENDLILGNLSEAKRHFEDCINTRKTEYLEYDMAQTELDHSLKGI